jgi:geranylgeranyl pyrophosphate synthase
MVPVGLAGEATTNPASGAVAASIDVARDFVRRGLEALTRLPDGPERLALAEFAGDIIDRNK